MIGSNLTFQMKLFLKVLFALVLMVVIGLIIILYPRFSNMRSEYGTARAIDDIGQYLTRIGGKWPESPADLDDLYPEGGEVFVDYSVTSRELIANPDRLREAVRPRSGRFETYPHYEEELDQLLEILKKTQIRRAEDD
jgi:hypothetical protein